jgi:Ca2+-transporting ATPase
MNWHMITSAEIFSLLNSTEKGLDSAIAAQRLAIIGANELKQGRKKSIWTLALYQFKDVMIIILLLAALISGVIGDLSDSIAILAIVLLNATMGFLQEYRTEKAIKSLQKMSIVQATVLRNGASTLLPAANLVPGDIVLLEAGNAVPADMRIFQSNNLKIDEASLTGESVPVEKTDGILTVGELPISALKNMAFKGTFVSQGRGAGITVATGMETELGKIAGMLQEDETTTPLQKRMAVFSKRLSVLVLFLCLLFFVAGWLRGEDTAKMLLTSISLAVSAIPEALPAVIAISLALAAKRMVKLKSLVRKLPAVETLGSVSYICTDKTGTLTLNVMRVEQLFIAGNSYNLNGFSTVKDKKLPYLLVHAAALNNDSIMDSQKKLVGDGTEIALMKFAQPYIDDNSWWPRLGEIGFDYERKLMTTFHAYGRKVISFTKGAPDILLRRCERKSLHELFRKVDEFSSKGYRVLAFAYRIWEEMPKILTATVHENELNFLGLVCIIDPPREAVSNAVAECRTAGIIPVMITGDHPLTAKAIAKRVGILSSEAELTITGEELAALTEDDLMARVEKIRVYARVSPAQKLQIIKMLQHKGHYVAMTGDGVNDAPSLKRADIGIAMGITGTDVAKEAAHMVLLDDNFSTIVRAVREGRRVYDNILKFIKYLMTTNSSELLVLLLGPMIGLPLALLPIHILWINLVSDGLPAITLSFEKGEKNIMNRKPRNPAESVFDRGRGIHMLWVGIFMAGIVLIAQGLAIKYGLHWQTIVFNLLSLSQMGHLLAIRSNHRSLFSLGVFSNRPLIMAVLAVFILQALVTFVPFLQPIFRTQTLSMDEFFLVALASSLVFFAVEIEKAIFRSKHAAPHV